MHTIKEFCPVCHAPIIRRHDKKDVGKEHQEQPPPQSSCENIGTLLQVQANELGGWDMSGSGC